MDGQEEYEKTACGICGKKLDENEDACPRCGNVIRKKTQGR